MILALETVNFRMMRANRVSLGPFCVFVGPNASGKTTFLDALCLLSDVLKKGVRAAVAERSPNFYDLCFDPRQPIGMAVDLGVQRSEAGTGDPVATPMRYEISLGFGRSDELRVLQEHLFILPPNGGLPPPSRSLFEQFTVVHQSTPKGWKKVVGKTEKGQDFFRDEKTSWNNMFRFGEDKPALGSIPEDGERFPRSLAVRDLLRDGVRRLALEPRRLQASSPPGGVPVLGVDGSNLPYVVRDLARRDPVLFSQWTGQIAGAVKGLNKVDVWERAEDKHLVLRAWFEGSHSDPVPSWMLSDGTLRLMALTVLSYAAVQEREEVYLVEEPENGLHPLAVQTMFEALSSPGTRQQWLCASHSPIFLANVELDQTVVFGRHSGGWSIVRRGREIPALSNWTGRVRLDEWLALGVLS
jgi:predicted ATPase